MSVHTFKYTINSSDLNGLLNGIDLDSLLDQIKQGLSQGTVTKPTAPSAPSADNGNSGSNAGSGNASGGSNGSAGSGAGNAGSGSAGSGNAGSGSNGSGTTNPGTTNPGSGSTVQTSQYAAEVAKLVNAERAKAGLGALAMDSKLSEVALAKAKDMYNKNYFSHTSPTYGSPFDMMKQFGVSFNYAGENIAKGQRTPAEVMNAWMNSSGHKANILGQNFTKIGVAYYNGVWVQMFIG
ncbi:serine protease [Cohnella algarum]|nr:serine protease [Cohnella algarum]